MKKYIKEVDSKVCHGSGPFSLTELFKGYKKPKEEKRAKPEKTTEQHEAEMTGGIGGTRLEPEYPFKKKRVK